MSLSIYGVELNSRLLLGTARYPSPAILSQTIAAAQVDVVTVSLRRELTKGRTDQEFWDLVRQSNTYILPNTAGCYSAKTAITTAELARDLFKTRWIKLEVIGNEASLQPDIFALVEAARELCQQGFDVLPYTTDDLVVAEKLLDAGCQVLMPWGAPIGSGQGLNNIYALRSLRAHFPDVPLIVDAGLGCPSHACQAMALGYDAVLLNTAVASARDPVQMGRAFALAVEAGRLAYRAGIMEPRDFAVPSTPLEGLPFQPAHRA